jgi:hypothetical protein
LSSGKSDATGSLLIKYLYNAGLISNPVFGFYLGGTDENSYLDIGSIQNSSMRDESELVWFKTVKNDFWWTSYATGISFKNLTGQPLSFKIDKSLAMTDTGTSCSYFPTKVY